MKFCLKVVDLSGRREREREREGGREGGRERERKRRRERGIIRKKNKVGMPAVL